MITVTTNRKLSSLHSVPGTQRCNRHTLYNLAYRNGLIAGGFSNGGDDTSLQQKQPKKLKKSVVDLLAKLTPAHNFIQTNKQDVLQFRHVPYLTLWQFFQIIAINSAFIHYV